MLDYVQNTCFGSKINEQALRINSVVPCAL